MANPKPVPLPMPLVVKNGSKIRSAFTSGGIAAARIGDRKDHIRSGLSLGIEFAVIRTEIDALCFQDQAPTVHVGMASRALMQRLSSICLIRPRSASKEPTPGSFENIKFDLFTNERPEHLHQVRDKLARINDDPAPASDDG